ncbi:hypothetical protein [Gulosibacter hominis]|uniref:hypothetical protein n=1 Tax=Gulosibacter hominis TaxID=2770504 RepID=UPI00191A6916|nr:hypothetical protein [Gulosibacter hominis]
MQASYSGTLVPNVPSLWQKYNWELPFSFLSKIDNDQYPIPLHNPPSSSIVSGFDATRALGRRSLTVPSEQIIPQGKFRTLLSSIYEHITPHPGICISVGLTDVEGWKDSTYTLFHQPRHLRDTHGNVREFSGMIQGQSWGNGSGLALLICFDSEVYTMADLTTSADLAFASALIAAGNICQNIVLDATQLGFRCRMTPAISESKAQQIYRLNDDIIPLHFLRIAFQAPDPRTSASIPCAPGSPNTAHEHVVFQ